MCRRRRKIILAVLVAVIAVIVAGYWYERPMILTGTGYAAHNACALKYVADRDDPDADLPPNPLKPLLRTGTGDDSATGSLLGVLAKQRAYATPGFGCTLADERPDLGPATKVSADRNPYARARLPRRRNPAVDAAVAKAFGDGLSADERKQLGTRGIVVVRDGKLLAERYATGFGPDVPQLGWSMTKSVTNLLVGRLVAEGKVRLDDDHLRPEWHDDRARITVRQLMQMTSGLAWDETYSLGTPITKMLYLERNMGAYVASRPLAHAPGSYQQYSTGSPTLLCAILAPKHGGADFPRRTLFAPLGLSSAVLEPDAVGTPVCGSYMWATPRDWAAVGQFALAGGVWNGKRLLPEGWMAESTRAVAVKSEDEGYATGWWANRKPDGRREEPQLPADAYFAEGHDGQWLIVVPSKQLVVARLGFTPDTDVDERAITLAADLIALG